MGLEKPYDDNIRGQTELPKPKSGKQLAGGGLREGPKHHPYQNLRRAFPLLLAAAAAAKKRELVF